MNDQKTIEQSNNFIQSTPPVGWLESTLGEVLPVQYGKGLIKSRRNTRGDVPVYGSSGQVGIHDQALTKGPTIIVGRKGSVGSVHYSSAPCWPIDTTYFVEAVDGLDLRFFAAQLIFLNLAKLEKSTAIPGLSRKDYDAVRCLIPPENEQKRIVAKLDELFSQLDTSLKTLRTTREKVKAYRASTLSHAVSGELSASWREERRAAGEPIEDAKVLLARILDERHAAWDAEQRAKRAAPTKVQNKLLDDETWKSKYPAPIAPDMSTLPALPDSWCWVSLEQIGEVIDPNPSHRMPNYTSKGIPFISSENFVDGDAIDFSIGKRVSPKVFEEQQTRFTIEENDIALSRIGTIGKTRFLPSGVSYCLSHALVVIKIRTDLLHKRYIRLCLSSNLLINQSKAGIQSVGVPDLGMGKIRGFTFPIPPLAEQEAIVSEVEQRLSAAAHTEASLNDNENRVGAMRQTILKRAFAGELVPSDPTDEPAKVLWERIRAARAAAEAQEREEKKLRPPQKRIMKLSNERKPLSIALNEAGGRLTPEELFSAAGFTWETVDEFYAELREQIGHTIAQERPNPTDVYLVVQNGASPAVQIAPSGEAA